MPDATDLAGRMAALATGDVAHAVGAALALLRDERLVEAAVVGPLRRLAAGDRATVPPAHRDGAGTGVVLAETEAARLSAHVARPGASPATEVVVPGRIAITRYHRADGLRIDRWRAGPCPDAPVAAALPPARRLDTLTPMPGAVLVHDGRVEGIVRRSTGRVVTLTLLLHRDAARHARAYATADGRLIGLSTNDPAASRTAMLLALLRADGRRDAAACFEAATRGEAFDLRWAAMREWLALDAPAAMPRLAAMAAGDPHPEVCATARRVIDRCR